MHLTTSCRLIAACMCLLGCEAGAEPTLDGAIGPAQPSCTQPPCVTLDAGAPGAAATDAAPPSSQPVLDAASSAPSLDAGGTQQPAPGPDAALDASDAAASPDASVSDTADAQLEAAAPSGDSGSPYPSVSDVNAKGPYSSMTVSNTGPGGAYTVFRPSELAPNGVLNPIVAWGNGGATTPVDYPQLPHLASHGFVVVASNNPLVNGQQVRAGVDWIVQQNEASGSPYYKKLDVKRIAGVGYSNGGLAQLETADDPRYLTLVIISGGNISEELRTQNMPKLHTPIAYLCTADDASKGNCAADFAVVKQPAFFGVMNGTGHTDVTTFLNIGVDSAIKRSAAATTAWLRWQLMSDASYQAWFVGSACTLCKDSAWTVQQKALQ